MTKEDIIMMAQEAGVLRKKETICTYAEVADLERFAELVTERERNRIWTQEHWTKYEEGIAAAEREACANFIEQEYVRQFDEPWRDNLAKAIRARGQV